MTMNEITASQDRDVLKAEQDRLLASMEDGRVGAAIREIDLQLEALDRPTTDDREDERWETVAAYETYTA